jgi:hypothetical protein
VPTWLIWLSLLTLPWTLNFSTHIVNPSYVLAAGVVFFFGFFEATPVLTHRILRSGVAWSMMGAGLLTMVQLHMSWVLLVPYVVAAMVSFVLAAEPHRPARPEVLARAAAAFVAGAAIPASLLVPTFGPKYLDSSGATLATREVVVKQILQPGESRTWSDVADGLIPAGTGEGTIEIVGAEKVIPRRVTTTR